MLPRYTADILPVIVVVLGLAARDIVPRREGTRRRPARRPRCSRWRRTSLSMRPDHPGGRARVVQRVQPHLRHQPPRGAPRRADRRAVRRAGAARGDDDLVRGPRPGVGRARHGSRTPGVRPPSHALRVVATDGTLHPANLVGTTAMAKADGPRVRLPPGPGPGRARAAPGPGRRHRPGRAAVLLHLGRPGHRRGGGGRGGVPLRPDGPAQQRGPRGQWRVRRDHPASGRGRRDACACSGLQVGYAVPRQGS